jgi:hypothetical protein
MATVRLNPAAFAELQRAQQTHEKATEAVTLALRLQTMSGNRYHALLRRYGFDPKRPPVLEPEVADGLPGR